MFSISTEILIGDFMKLIDMAGKICGKLTVLEKIKENRYLNGEAVWKCVCCCERKGMIYALGSELRKGSKKHCGCVFDPSTKEFWEHLRNRLEQRSSKNGNCKEWVGFRDKGGYGHICVIINKKEHPMGCHRASWIIHKGPIPENMEVCHKCDNPACFNIEHLFLGTHQENIDDKMRKNRHICPKGEKNSNSKLTEEQVKYILSMKNKISSHALCKQFNISASGIRGIWQRKNWKHIEIPSSLL